MIEPKHRSKQIRLLKESINTLEHVHATYPSKESDSLLTQLKAILNHLNQESKDE